MNTGNLKQLIAIHETGNFSRAASRLGITQPAVSLAIKNLERELGVKIFDRSSGKYLPTPEGEIVLEYARKGLLLEDKMFASLRSANKRGGGKLNLASSNIPGEYILPSLVGEFKEEFPATDMLLNVSDSRLVTAKVAAGEAELGFVGGKVNTRRFSAYPFCPDTLILVAPPGHRLANKASLDPARLLEEEFIIREDGSGTRDLMLASLKAIGIPMGRVRIAMELGSTSAVLAAVESGAGITMVSIWAASKLLDEKRVLRLRVRGLKAERNFYMVRPVSTEPSEAAQSFAEFVKSKGKVLAAREKALLRSSKG